VAVEYAGEPVKVAFNAKQLLDALGAMSAERATMALGGTEEAALLTGDADYRCVVMPVRM
jgi:DNA polymerase III sliding clamp (beta) subunit (PCNA family)